MMDSRATVKLTYGPKLREDQPTLYGPPNGVLAQVCGAGGRQC